MLSGALSDARCSESRAFWELHGSRTVKKHRHLHSKWQERSAVYLIPDNVDYQELDV